MPYIDEKERKELANRDNQFPTTKGQINYLVTRIALQYIDNKGLGYTNISTAIGALIDSAEEIRRRLLNGYEDEAIHRNGDLELFKKVRKYYT